MFLNNMWIVMNDNFFLKIFGLISLFNCICKSMDLLMSKPSTLKNNSGSIYLITCVSKRDHTFPKGISQKVNVIARLQFELNYSDVAI